MQTSKMLLPLLMAASPALVFAANTVQFGGDISAATCDITVNGVPNPIVRLPTILASDLQNANSSGGETNFTVEAKNCSTSNQPAELQATFTANVFTSTGSLANIGGTATNVGLQISTISNGTALNLRTPWTSGTGTGIQIPANGNSGTRDYYVRYYSAAGYVSAGTVKSTMQYVVAYP